VAASSAGGEEIPAGGVRIVRPVRNLPTPSNEIPAPSSATRRRARHATGAIAAAIASLALSVAIGPAAIAEPAADLDRIVLGGGGEVTGRIVKRGDQSVWIDVGPQVLELRLADIREIHESESDRGAIGAAASGGLYATAADLPERSAREHSRSLGPTVLMVSTPRGLGSGVFVHRDGYAISNAHVVQGETALRATVWIEQPDGSLRRTTIDEVEIVALNNHYDLALLKVPHPRGEAFPTALLEHDDRLVPGQAVFAIGNPRGLEQTLTEGVVSTRNRVFGGLGYIQTDAAINPGNSGGPLFNHRGEVVGITNMALLASESLNFAIPARYVKDFLRNREAFAYDATNPNSGHRYHEAPPRRRGGVPPQLTPTHSTDTGS